MTPPQPGQLFAVIADVEVCFTAHATDRLHDRSITPEMIVTALEAEPAKLRAAIAMKVERRMRFGKLVLVLRCVGERTILVVTAYRHGTYRRAA